MSSKRVIFVSTLWLVNTAWGSPATLEEGVRLKNAQQLSQATSIFRQILVADSENIDALEQLAVVESWQHDYDTSIALWDRVLQLDGNRSGARLAKARVQFWKKDNAAALAGLDVQLKSHPDDEEAWILRGDILLSEEEYAQARSAYVRARDVRGGSAALEKKIAAAAAPPKWRIDVGAATDHYDVGRGTEYSQYVQASYRIGSTASAYLHYDRQDQFGVVDHSYTAGTYLKAGKALALNLEATFTPNAYFRPDHAYHLEVELIYSPTWQPLLGYRAMHYDTQPIPNSTAVGGHGNVSTVTPGLRWNMPVGGNIELRYGLTHNIDGSNTAVGQLRYNASALGHLSPYLGVAHGKEALPPQPAATLTVATLGGVYRVTDRFGIRVDVAYEDRQNFYHHTTGAVGASVQF